MELFDSHCHVYDDRMPDGPPAALDAARAAGVTGMVAVGCDRPTSEASIAVAQANDDVWATVGLHPHDADQGVDTIVDLIGNSGVVAIGEAGLDYYYDNSPRDVQRTAFAAQIQLAHEHDLPLVIHTRDAWDDTFDVLDAEGMPNGTVFHCFTGGPDEARRCLDRGAHVSFSGIVTFKTATDLQAAARLVPLDRMLIETDAPYLAPVPHRGKTNQPAYVAHTAQFIADLRDVRVSEVAEATARNARQVFRLG
ncbi:TatD DNase family protein [Ilumatobacter fluminis]|uniref:TatD DNase family protein n=1 Tax=Ilumatobacter fluminis TaxID=467091 RepID=A0A4R7HZJ6_9ACTN|nr:TatD family hydrolase [Ilumatobacter fluminis]TDT15593.1 TatD DNase family protein [Ilumatobacter fluminis]